MKLAHLFSAHFYTFVFLLEHAEVDGISTGAFLNQYGASQQAALDALQSYGGIPLANLQLGQEQLQNVQMQGTGAMQGEAYQQVPNMASPASAPVASPVAAPASSPLGSNPQQQPSLEASQPPNLPAMNSEVRWEAMGSPAAAPAASPSAGNSENCVCEESAPTCRISKVSVRQDHANNGGLSLADVTGIYGGNSISKLQRQMVELAHISATSFMCLDDRVTEPSLVTPGGDLGEFVLGLASYLQERSSGKENHLTQEAVEAILLKYVQTLPSGRPLLHCTDERAISHLEGQLPVENLNLQSPPEVQQHVLLQRLMEVENHGDNHMRLMLKKPEWYQLSEELLPMVLRSFYRLLWQQHQNPDSPLYQSPKLKLQILHGVSNPQAFFEVTSSDLCQGQDMAPMLIPRQNGRSVLVSHLDAVSVRRAELATFFARIAQATPQKVDPERLHQRLDRHGWLALETTGSRVASALPFYTLSYT